MHMTKWITAALSTALIVGTVSSGAMAFNDLDGVQYADKIRELRDRGIVSGISSETFAPHGKILAEQAVALLVKGLDLNIDHIRFVKGPQASDYFTNVPNDAWYAEAFMIAHLNGLPIERDIQPAAEVTREQFVNWLMYAVNTKGEFPYIMKYVMFEDENAVKEDYMNAIQQALIIGVAELDKEKMFRPQDVITRGEAAVMVNNAIHFVKEQEANQPNPPAEEPKEDPVKTGEVTTSVEAVYEGVNKVTVSWGQKPHPGYSIGIQSIEFTGETSAVVRYKLGYPDPNRMYPMVIVYPEASTMLDAKYTDITYELVP